MKKQIISASGILLAIAVAGCNPVGMEDTRLWVTGTIYVDSTFTQPAEGIGVMTKGTQESYVVETNASGYFEIEIQLYLEVEEEEQYSGGVTFGVKAINGDREYEYGGTGTTFTVFGGDTLSLYAIDLTDFTEPGGN